MKTLLFTPSLDDRAGRGIIKSRLGIQATADDTPTGEVTVVAAEYFIDTITDPGSGISMTLNAQAPIVSLNATIDTATINSLAHGTHVVYVRAQDELGNWGAVGEVDLEVDLVGVELAMTSWGVQPKRMRKGIAPAGAEVIHIR